jgi:serine/threonine protein kinase
MLHQRWFQNIVETELANRFFYIVLPGTTSNNLTILQQVLEDQGYDGAMADLWSCGVILFVLLAGYLPFEDSNLMALYKKVSIVLRLEHYYGFLSMFIWFVFLFFLSDIKCRIYISTLDVFSCQEVVNKNPWSKSDDGMLEHSSWFNQYLDRKISWHNYANGSLVLTQWIL